MGKSPYKSTVFSNLSRSSNICSCRVRVSMDCSSSFFSFSDTRTITVAGNDGGEREAVGDRKKAYIDFDLHLAFSITIRRYQMICTEGRRREKPIQAVLNTLLQSPNRTASERKAKTRKTRRLCTIQKERIGASLWFLSLSLPIL